MVRTSPQWGSTIPTEAATEAVTETAIDTAPGTLPPSGGMPNPQRAGLMHLPQEMLEQVADHLPAKDLRALALTSRESARAVDYQLKRAMISHQIARISGSAQPPWGERLETFQRLLTAIQGLRKSDQPRQALQALSACLDLMPEAECRQAAANLLTLHPLLPESLHEPLKILAEHGSPTLAIAGGVSVETIVRHFYPSCEGRARNDLLLRLESTAIHLGPAEEALRAGDDPDEVAQRFGIENTFVWALQRRIEQRADVLPGVLAVARRAVRGGERVDEVAPRLRLIEQHDIEDLELFAAEGVAGEAVALGEPVDQVAERHGIRSVNGRWALERAACCGAACEAVRRGHLVDATADRHGILDPLNRYYLLLQAMTAGPGDAVRNGTAVEDVARLHGVDLSALAIELQARAPKRYIEVDLDFPGDHGEEDDEIYAQRMTQSHHQWLVDELKRHAESRPESRLQFRRRFMTFLTEVPARERPGATGHEPPAPA